MNDLVTKQNGKSITWNGHLCEGSMIVPGEQGTFLLWTRCQEKDVPANAATTGSREDVTCAGCLTFLE